jgi:hypothetical protein
VKPHHKNLANSAPGLTYHVAAAAAADVASVHDISFLRSEIPRQFEACALHSSDDTSKLDYFTCKSVI